MLGCSSVRPLLSYTGLMITLMFVFSASLESAQVSSFLCEGDRYLNSIGASKTECWGDWEW